MSEVFEIAGKVTRFVSLRNMAAERAPKRYRYNTQLRLGGLWGSTFTASVPLPFRGSVSVPGFRPDTLAAIAPTFATLASGWATSSQYSCMPETSRCVYCKMP